MVELKKNLKLNKVKKSKSTKLGRFHFFEGLVLMIELKLGSITWVRNELGV